MNRPDEPIPGQPPVKRFTVELSPVTTFIMDEAKRIQEEYISERDLILLDSHTKWSKIIEGLTGISKRLTPEEEGYKKLISDVDKIDDSNNL